MAKRFLPPNLSWYANQPFVWNLPEFGAFCNIMYKQMWLYICSKSYITEKPEYEDALQNAIVRLINEINDKGRMPENNEKAAQWLKTFYYQAIIDEYRRKKRSARLNSENRDKIRRYSHYSADEKGRSIDRLIEIAFGEMDKAIEDGRCHLTSLQMEFYLFYRALSLSNKSFSDFTEIITTNLVIEREHYRKLKSELKAKFITLLANTNIFINK